MKETTAMALVTYEIERAKQLYKPMQSFHEGYAVILAEMNELWDEVRRSDQQEHRIVSEAVQVAAAALRLLEDLCKESSGKIQVAKVEKFDKEIKDAKIIGWPSYGASSSCYSG